MRKLSCVIAFLFLSAIAFGQTSTVTGHTITGQNTTSSSGISVLFELINDGGQQCKVSGTGLVMPMTASFTQAQLAAGVALLRNDQITCGTTLGATRWRYTIKANGVGTRQCSVNIATATLNLDSTACLNAAATPVTVTPTDSVYCRLDGTNCGFTGPITGTTFNFSSNGLIGGTLGVTGRSTFANGTPASPGINFTGSATSGFYYNVPSTFVGLSIGGSTTAVNNGSWQIGSGLVYGFTSTADPSAAANDTAMSRCAAGVVCAGTGSSGNITGTFKAQTFSLPTSSNTLPATFSNDGTGGINLTPNGGGGWTLVNDGRLFSGPGKALVLQGATSGNTTVQPAAIASGTLTLPAATDTLVAQALAQSLFNKVLLGAGVSNSVTLISACKFDNAAAIVGTGADANIFSCTFPANTLAAGKCFHTQGSWQHSTGTAGVTYKFTYGASTQAAGADAGTGVVTWKWNVCNKSGVTNAQTLIGDGGFDGVAVAIGGVFLSGANDTTTGLTLKFTFNVAATDQVTPLQMITWLDQ